MDNRDSTTCQLAVADLGDAAAVARVLAPFRAPVASNNATLAGLGMRPVDLDQFAAGDVGEIRAYDAANNRDLWLFSTGRQLVAITLPGLDYPQAEIARAVWDWEHRDRPVTLDNSDLALTQAVLAFAARR